MSDFTEPESLGQPEPEKTRRVIVGGVGGAATARSARLRNGKMRACIFFFLESVEKTKGEKGKRGDGKGGLREKKRMERGNVLSFW